MFMILAMPFIFHLLALGVLITHFWYPVVGLSFLLFMNLALWLSLYAVQKDMKNFRAPEELSTTARLIFEKYPSFFTHPFASKIYGGFAAGMQFVGVGIALISFFHHDDAYMLIVAIVNWFSCAHVSQTFNPLHALHRSGYSAELEEISRLMIRSC